MLKFNLIPATERDFGFLKSLHKLTMKEHVAAIWGWDDKEQDQLFLDRFEPSEIQIIKIDNIDIGMVSSLNKGNEIFLANILLMPEYQSIGIGSKIIEGLKDEARQKKAPLTLTVLRPNKALNFYKKLGFKVVKEDEIRFYMEWRC